jgi:hypothetical protein
VIFRDSSEKVSVDGEEVLGLACSASEDGEEAMTKEILLESVVIEVDPTPRKYGFREWYGEEAFSNENLTLYIGRATALVAL